jgi:CheY-like chemotaxis protein
MFPKGQEQESQIIDRIRQRACRVLVIDDDDNFRQSFSFLLRRKFNADVEEVDSGAAALERLKSKSTFDVIFVDMMMPGMTGIETYEQLRKFGIDTVIVIMSAYTDSEQWNRAQLMPDLILIHKPLPESDLLKVLSADSQ